MLCMVVLAALARLTGADVSCATACARCGDPPSELTTVYCSLCRECRDRRREWLETVSSRRNMAPVSQPNYYREVAYYKKDATVWNTPGGTNPASCPPAPSCDDGGQFAYVKVYGLKHTCPPAAPCVTQTTPPPTTYAPPRSRKTKAPRHAHPSYCCANRCCPTFMPMMPYSCICPLGAYGPGAGAFGPGPRAFGPGAGVFGPGVGAFGPGMGAFGLGAGVFGPGMGIYGISSETHDSSSGTNVTSQPASDQRPTTSSSSAHTEPVYLYIGIPKK